MNSPHPTEQLRSQRANWLRAVILGTDDGIISLAMAVTWLVGHILGVNL